MVDWPIPTTKREVQQLLGLVSYYRRFIERCAQIAKPRHQLTERNKPFLEQLYVAARAINNISSFSFSRFHQGIPVQMLVTKG